RSLSDVTELPARRWELPVLRRLDGNPGESQQ
ncbi:MAG: antitermination protein NusB, partial [Mycobacterium sp.]